MNSAVNESVTVQPSRVAWSIDEVTAALGVSQGFVRTLIRSKRLPHRKLGRRVLILDRDLQEFLAKPETSAGGGT